MAEKITDIDESGAEAAGADAGDAGAEKDPDARLTAARKKFSEAVDGVTRKAQGASARTSATATSGSARTSGLSARTSTSTCATIPAKR